MILFKTILKVKDEKIENTIPLFPLLSSDFLKLLSKAGFEKVETYGDFKGSPYSETESYLMVIRA